MSSDPRTHTIERSRALFAEGYCCAESVLLALSEHLDRDPGMLIALASGFCGGIAGTGQTCGAVSGAIMAIGLALGPVEPHADHRTIDRAAQAFIRRFLDEFGSMTCRNLLEHDVAPGARRPDATCADYVGEAVRIVLDVLEDY